MADPDLLSRASSLAGGAPATDDDGDEYSVYSYYAPVNMAPPADNGDRPAAAADPTSARTSRN